MRLLAVMLLAATAFAFIAWAAQAKSERPLCYVKDPADPVMMTENGNGLRKVHGFIRIKCVRDVDLITVAVCLHRTLGEQTDYVICRNVKATNTSEVLAHVQHLCAKTARKFGWFVKGIATIYDRRAYGKGSPLVDGPTLDWACL